MPPRKNRTRKARNEQTAQDYFLEQAAAYYNDVKTAAHNAPYGQFLNVADAIALEKGRELTRLALETISQEAIDDIEKKKKRGSVQNVKRKKDIRDTATKKSSPPAEL